MAYTAQDKKEKSLGELIVVIVILALLMTTFIHYFFKRSDEFTHAGFNALANAFSAQINAIHAQWIMDKKPDYLYLKEFTRESQEASSTENRLVKQKLIKAIPMNKKGWVDIPEYLREGNHTRCAQIWQYVMESPMSLMKETISATQLLKNKGQLSGVICKYSIDNKVTEFFEYDTTSGKVSSIVKVPSIES